MARQARAIDVSIVMPCLNEAESLPHCIANAHDALARIESEYGLSGEIIIADNGSIDGSQGIAESLDARVVSVASLGYGAAIIGGCYGADGRYLLIGDADGSYDFTDGVAMVGRLTRGADLCMGSRFAGGIEPGAMPWKNRYIGNPLLTGLLNLLFRSGVNDAHCGLRAIRRETFLALNLSGSGMEFASEMVIKASLKRVRIEQAPATLSVDLRNRPPHLRPWRDGWRHLRYLLMLSPTWLFGIPAIAAMAVAGMIMLVALANLLSLLPGVEFFGTSWTLVAGFLFCVGHLSGVMAIATHLHGVGQEYREMAPILRRYAHVLTLETTLIVGIALLILSGCGLGAVALHWSIDHFAALATPLPLIIACVAGATGLQTIMGGFLLSIIAGHQARFVTAPHPIDFFANLSPAPQMVQAA
ncbi:glycosyltransferase family 2 protein [Sphingomonas oligophenolica]|nr:glycosyltransferase family 2 protein [Sphingomonas oligophenolica]